MERIRRRDAMRLIGAAWAAGVASSRARGEGETQPRPLVRRIGTSDETLPLIGLGTWQTFDVGPSDAERAPLEEVLAAFVALGGRLVDTSPMYGRAETVVGDLAAKLGLQSKLFLATKVWISGKQAGIDQMRDSMRKLRTQKLDLEQVHNLLDADAHLGTLSEWKKEGRVRYVGVTHYQASHHDDVARVIEARPVDFVQIDYSVGERDAERRLLPLAKERGIAVIANRPFGGGELLRRAIGRPLPPWAAEIDCDSWAQILLKFVVSHPAITCAIPATSKVAHLRDDMKAAIGRMPDEALRAKIVAACE
jgi:diketogulonate reductase-like aldo/keto reductase